MQIFVYGYTKGCIMRVCHENIISYWIKFWLLRISFEEAKGCEMDMTGLVLLTERNTEEIKKN